MHAAPPVRIQLAPDAPWRVFVVGCTSAAAANAAAWMALFAQAPPAIAAVAALLAACLAAGMAWHGLWRGAPVRGVLAWDGAVWQLARGASKPVDGAVRVMVDLGAWMLLRFVPGTPATQAAWLVASRRQGGSLWPLWRAALFSPAPSTAATAATDPP